MTGFVFNMTGFVLRKPRFVLNITGFVLKITGFVLNMTGFVLNITGFINKKNLDIMGWPYTWPNLVLVLKKLEQVFAIREIAYKMFKYDLNMFLDL